MKTRIIFAISLLLAGPVAGAQVQNVAMPFLELDQNPATSGMAGASVLKDCDRSDIFASYSSWQQSSTQFFNLTGNIAVGQKILIKVNGTYGKEESYRISSGLASTVATFTPSEMVFGASALFRLLPMLSVEAGLRYASMKLSSESTVNAFSGDILLKGYLSGFSATAGVTNVGSKAGGFNLPSAAVLAVAYDNGADADHRIRPEVDGKYYFSGVFGLSAGIDYTFRDLLSVRAGYHLGGVVADYASVGLGVNFGGLHIDASYLVKTAFCIGLGYRF